MKVLHITNNFPTNRNPIFGIFVKEQIESLSLQGIENEIYFINGREKCQIEYLKAIIYLKNKLKNHKYDIIHCHHALCAIVLILSGACKDNKVLVSFQNDPKHELGSFVFNIIKRHSDGIILKNRSSFDSDDIIFYLPNGVNTTIFKPISRSEACEKLNLDLHKRYILFVSSNKLRKQKRYDRFKATMLLLKRANNNFEELSLINIRRELVPYYFNAASLHLLTSDFEGSPNSVKESMACNTPVVSTNVGNVNELLDGVNESYVSRTNDPEELARLVHIALNSREFFGRKKIIELKLDIESVAKKLKEVYILLH